MSPQAALARLVRGPRGLSRTQMRALVEAIRALDEAEAEALLASLYRPAEALSRAAPPAWLAEIETARRRLKTWSAAEVVDALYALAAREGWVEAGAARPARESLAAAARRLAARVGEARVCTAFVAWVEDHLRENARG